MTLLHAVILGIVEGVTEFLPISSTGHLIIVEKLLGVTAGEFEKTFTIAVQFGAVAAVLLLYWKKFFDIEVLKRLAAAFIPTAVIGLLLHKLFKQYLADNVMVVAAALIVGGIILIAFERWQRAVHTVHKVDSENATKISLRDAALIGLAQCLAIIPGVSRSGASIVGGVALGLPRAEVVEFSFLLAVPTIAAAAGLDLLKTGFGFTGSDWIALLVGLIVAFVVAYASIKWLIGYVKKHTLESFGWYRIAIGAIVFLFLFV